MLKAGSVKALIQMKKPAVAIVADASGAKASSSKTGIVTPEGTTEPSKRISPPEVVQPKPAVAPPAHR